MVDHVEVAKPIVDIDILGEKDNVEEAAASCMQQISPENCVFAGFLYGETHPNPDKVGEPNGHSWMALMEWFE